MCNISITASSHGSGPTAMTGHYDPKQRRLHSVYPGIIVQATQTIRLQSCIHPTVHVSVSLSERWAYLALWVCCECTVGPHTPPLTAGLPRDKASHSSVAVEPPYMHIGVHVHKHVHSLPSIVFSFHMLKNTQQPTQSPLPQSTSCNIPVSHPGLSSNDITTQRDRHDI